MLQFVAAMARSASLGGQESLQRVHGGSLGSKRHLATTIGASSREVPRGGLTGCLLSMQGECRVQVVGIKVRTLVLMSLLLGTLVQPPALSYLV